MKFYSEVAMSMNTKKVYEHIAISGKVHSIFSSTINILDERGILLTLADETFMTAPNLFQVTGFTPKLLDLNEGDDVRLMNHQLIIEQKLLVDYGSPFIKREQPIIYQTKKEQLTEKLHQVIQQDWYLDKKKSYQQQSFMRSISQTIDECSEIIKTAFNHDSKQILKALQKLIGLGIGLTPSGDDFLTGLAIVASTQQYPKPQLLELLKEIQQDINSQTNIISYQQFSMGLAGRAREEILITLRALLSPHTNEDELLAIQSILTIGSTSGFDILQGMLVGLEVSLL